jgi:polar amino acid transport system substrate-binding protein
MRRIFGALGLTAMLCVACGSGSRATDSAGPTATAASSDSVAAAARSELAPTGRLRLGFPASAPFLGHQDPASGQWKGLAIVEGSRLAAALGVSMVPQSYPDPGAAFQALLAGQVDVVFAPSAGKPDTAASTQGAVHVEHTYLVGTGSSLHSVSEVDRQGIRVGSVEGDGHTPFLAAHLQHAQLMTFPSGDAALTALTAGRIDAYADARPALIGVSAHIAGSRLLDGSFFDVNVGFASVTSHRQGAAFLDSFVASQLSSGDVQRDVAAIGVPGVLAGPAV